MKDVSAKQSVVAGQLDKVEAKMKDLIDPKPTVVEVDPMDRHDPPKKDTTAYQKNLEKIMKEEEELEEKKEAIEAAKKDVPKNPVVEASEAAEEAHVE